MICISMLKICGKSISEPLEIIFKSCIEKGHFPDDWIKGNVVPDFHEHSQFTGKQRKGKVIYLIRLYHLPPAS